jgi:predicted alpha-1,2-mannosidase
MRFRTRTARRKHVGGVLAAVGGALAVVMAAAMPAGAATAARPSGVSLVSDPTQYVDPMVGTGTGGQVVGNINEFPGVDTPFGMMQLSPETHSGEGYLYSDPSILGFGIDNASTGCSSFGDIPVLPTTGAVTNPATTTATFSHDTEHATPGSYNVLLNNSNIEVNLTATTRTGLLSFAYPSGSTGQVLVKSGTNHGGIRAATVNVAGDDEVTGSATTNGLCGQGSYTVYFDIRFSQPFTAHGTWQGSTVTAGSSSASGSGSGAYLTFDTSTSRTVVAKEAMSYVSVAGARANMAAEIHGFGLAPVAASTRTAWRDALDRVQIGGGSKADMTTFYTALYHSLQFPSVFNDVNGEYMGFDNKVHRVPPGHAQYANYSDWDTYRALAPFQAMLFPKQAGDMANSLLRDAQQEGGWWPRWPMANTNTATMNGDSGVALFANLAAFGGAGIDVGDALPIMEKGATQSAEEGWGWEERPCVEQYVKLGYDPNDACANSNEGVSETLEWSIDDFAISRLAASAGQSATAAQYQQRSENWQNLLNPVNGYMQPRDDNGAFPNGPINLTSASGYEEGNAAQYNWLVPQDMAGLIAAMGGDKVAASRLDTFFTGINDGPNVPYDWAGDEPDLGTPWTYDYVGEPWQTQAEARRQEQQLYAPGPNGLPGNDDLGAMSSWYVWAALGLYPVTPGTSNLAMDSPLFPRAVVHLGDGRNIDITAPKAAENAPYITGVRLDGRSYSSTALPLSFATQGGDLDFSLSTTPDKSWGTAPDDAPPSYQTGQDPALGLLNPSGNQVVTGGESLPVTVGAQGTGAKPTTVHWSVSAPAGVTVSPSSGTLDAPSIGQVTTTTKVTMPASVASGYYPMTVTYTGPNGQRLGPGNVLVLTVQEDDQTAIVADDLGNTAVPNGLTQIGQGDGQTAATTAGGLPGLTTTGTGSSYMYFNVDDNLVPGGNYQATAYVSYYDHGTSSWDIQYDAASPASAYQNSAEVTDTNTDTWKTATIPLPGAAFSDGENGGTDFRLNIGSGGQVVIGRVGLTVTGSNVLAMHLASAQPVAPAVTTQPQDATVASGASATFTAAASGDPAPVVQWQSATPGSASWTDVSGATSPTLSVPDVASTADGTQYRAVFTNLAGDVTTSTATLHVQ